MSDVALPIETPTEARDFDSFFRAEYRSLCEALVLLVGDPLEAEELAQETMTRVLERWDRVGAMDSPAGYAYRTALTFSASGSGDWLSALSDGSQRSRLPTSEPERATVTTCGERSSSSPMAYGRR